MSRPLRLEFPGALHHVTSRGNGDQPIFLEDGDRQLFLDLLAREIRQHRWICHGYCLLDRSYRLLVETPEADLGRGIGRLNAIYSQFFNRRYQRQGAVFRGRYKSVLVEKQRWLAAVARDLAWAPVRAGLAERPSQWHWSSHRVTAKDRHAPSWLVIDDVLAEFVGGRTGPRKAYRTYVAEGKKESSPFEAVQAQIYLGDEDWRKDVEQRLRCCTGEPVARCLFSSDRPNRDSVINAVAELTGVPRTSILDRSVRQDVFRVTVYLLRRAANLPLKEVAELARVSPPRISQIQRAIEDAGGLRRAYRWAEPLASLLS